MFRTLLFYSFTFRGSKVLKPNFQRNIFVRFSHNHIVCSRPGKLSEMIFEDLQNQSKSFLSKEIDCGDDLAKIKNQNQSEVFRLLKMGAVYHKIGNTTERPERVIEDRNVNEGDYIRYCLNPREYDSESIDWKSLILRNEKDYVIINKPAGIPSVPTIDNYFSNVIEAMRKCLKSDKLYSAHRLDIDTSGIYLIGKDKESICYLCDLFRYRKIFKLYKIMIMTTNSSNLHSLKVDDILTHYTGLKQNGHYFSKEEKPNSKLCLSRIVSISPIVTKSKKDWFMWLDSLKLPNDEKFSKGFVDWLSAVSDENDNSKKHEVSFGEIELELKTGRTHQCRGQVKAMGKHIHIAGDYVYGIEGSTENDGDCGENEENKGKLKKTYKEYLEYYRGEKDINELLELNKVRQVKDSDNIEIVNGDDEEEVEEYMIENSPYLALQACYLKFYDTFSMRNEMVDEEFEKIYQEKIEKLRNSRADRDKVEFLIKNGYGRKTSKTIKREQRQRLLNVPNSDDDDNNLKVSGKKLVEVRIEEAWWSPLSKFLKSFSS